MLTTIKNYIQERIEEISATELKQRVLEHYKLLGLIDDQGEWTTELIAKHAANLIPDELSSSLLNKLIEDSTDNLKQNTFLSGFFDQLKQVHVGELTTEGELIDDDVLKDIISYAFVLETLTKTSIDSSDFFAHIREVFLSKRKKEKSLKKLPFFHKLKLLSIEIPVKKYVKNFETGHVNPGSSRYGVAINIWEAVVADWKDGFKDNAIAGKVLAQNKCGEKNKNLATGAGPSGWSADKKFVTRHYPNCREWVDLYQTWNMAFCTRFSDFPFIVPKLVIPAVSGYGDHPENYIYSRCVALYIYLNYASFRLAEGKPTHLNWHSKALQQAWGKHNKVCSEKYKEGLRKSFEQRAAN